MVYHTLNNAHGDDGQTPLQLASKEGHINVTRLLLEHGVDVDARDDSRNTALHYASKIEVVHLLVEHGANIDTENDEGRTASQSASENGCLDIAKLLSDLSSK